MQEREEFFFILRTLFCIFEYSESADGGEIGRLVGHGQPYPHGWACATAGSTAPEPEAGYDGRGRSSFHFSFLFRGMLSLFLYGSRGMLSLFRYGSRGMLSLFGYGSRGMLSLFLYGSMGMVKQFALFCIFFAFFCIFICICQKFFVPLQRISIVESVTL